MSDVRLPQPGCCCDTPPPPHCNRIGVRASKRSGVFQKPAGWAIQSGTLTEATATIAATDEFYAMTDAWYFQAIAGLLHQMPNYHQSH